MLKINRFILIFLLIIFSASPSVASRSFLMVGDPWPPWVNGKFGGDATGIAPDYINKIFAGLNKKTEMKLYPWKRVLKMAEYGIADGVIIIQPDTATYPYLTFTSPIFTSYEILCFNKKRMSLFKWSKIKDLKNYRIGTIIGYSYGDFSSKAKKTGLKLEPVKTLNINIEKLLKNRIDLIICDKKTLQEEMRLNPELKKFIGKAKKPVQKWDYSIGISKSSPLSLEINKINKIISKMQKKRTF